MCYQIYVCGLYQPHAYPIYLSSIIIDPHGSSLKIEQYISLFHRYMDLAELYHIYHHIYCFVEQPFTSHIPEALLNMSRFLAHRIMKTTPLGISKVYPYMYIVAHHLCHLPPPPTRPHPPAPARTHTYVYTTGSPLC